MSILPSTKKAVAGTLHAVFTFNPRLANRFLLSYAHTGRTKGFLQYGILDFGAHCTYLEPLAHKARPVLLEKGEQLRGPHQRQLHDLTQTVDDVTLILQAIPVDHTAGTTAVHKHGVQVGVWRVGKKKRKNGRTAVSLQNLNNINVTAYSMNMHTYCTYYYVCTCEHTREAMNTCLLHVLYANTPAKR